jgi:hypothetical protein
MQKLDGSQEATVSVLLGLVQARRPAVNSKANEQ